MKTTLQELVDFFKGNVKCSLEEVQRWCVLAFHHGTLLCVKDPTGKIIGGCTAYKKDSETLFVTMIYVLNPFAMKEMVKHLDQYYPEYKLEARRHGKDVVYPVEKLKIKLWNLWKKQDS